LRRPSQAVIVFCSVDGRARDTDYDEMAEARGVSPFFAYRLPSVTPECDARVRLRVVGAASR
jgi:hypothetical protein